MAEWEMIIKSSVALCWCPNELFSSGHLLVCLHERRGRWRGTSSLISWAHRRARRQRWTNGFRSQMIRTRASIGIPFRVDTPGPQRTSLMTFAALWPLVQHHHQDKMSSRAPQHFKQTCRINPRQLSTWGFVQSTTWKHHRGPVM